MRMLFIRKASYKNSKGFTLIELLVVIVILGIISTIAISNFRSSQMRSRDARRKSDLKQIANALEVFYSDRGRYPSSSNGLIVACPYNTTSPANCTWGSLSSNGEFRDSERGVTYFKSLPSDPSGFSYYYVASSSGNSFQIYAHLENPKDQNCVNSNCSTSARVGVNCGGSSAPCNFAITSPNVTPIEAIESL